MVLLDRSEVRSIPLDVYFEFKNNFKIKFFFKMTSVWMCFSTGFPIGGGFPAEQLHPRGALHE
jgi:hypothetical protein